MLSNNPAEKPQLSASHSGAAEVSVLNPQDPIEVTPTVPGPVNDPAASDPPPGVTSDLDYLSNLI